MRGNGGSRGTQEQMGVAGGGGGVFTHKRREKCLIEDWAVISQTPFN